MTDAVPYSRIDRLTHRLAFRSSILQGVLSDAETKLLAGRWIDFQARQPIFITSLPRAGTTIILGALHRLPGLAAHTYRDMPFLLAPVLWNRLSSSFHRRSAVRERAHGDGLAVNEDSPEAFEEVLWQKFYVDKYKANRIDLWRESDIDARFTKYMRDHMKKIVALRQPQHPLNGRYISKNNANVARIELLRIMMPDAFIIVPLRHPVEHAISMLRQHRNFLSQHTTDSFIRDYMADLGHFEFGALHKPIAVDGLTDLIGDLKTDSIDYWLAYWVSVFEYLATQQGIHFVSYESLCESPNEGIAGLADHLEIQADADAIAGAAGVFRPVPPARSDTENLPDMLTDRALSVYENLKQKCLLRP